MYILMERIYVLPRNHIFFLYCYLFCRNLLQPSGVMLRPAIFSLKVYKAEDIPQS